jgi:hypothetical protein
MPEDDSGGSTDLSDVFLQAMATPVFRPIAVWMISVAGVFPCLMIHALSDVDGWVREDDFWLIVLGPPVSLIGGLGEGMSEAWKHSLVRVWTLRVLLPLGALLWGLAAFRVCAGRRIHSSLCHLYFASFLITSGWLEHLWWVGVLLSAGMVWMYWNMKFFGRIRAEEQEFERDGI